jgi:uncharacterized Zn finger protein (UPF0148 family)
MDCRFCGAALPAAAAYCPACGKPTAVPPPPGAPPSPNRVALDDAVSEARRAMDELANATAHVSHSVVRSAKAAVKDPSAAAKKAMERLARELDAARDKLQREIDGMR